MGASLKLETMEGIIDKQQESVALDPETDTRIAIQSAMCVIKSALDDRNPSMVRRGIRKLIQACYGFELSESDMLMLAARRQIYIEQVEEVKDYVTQNTTPIS